MAERFPEKQKEKNANNFEQNQYHLQVLYQAGEQYYVSLFVFSRLPPFPTLTLSTANSAQKKREIKKKKPS